MLYFNKIKCFISDYLRSDVVEARPSWQLNSVLLYKFICKYKKSAINSYLLCWQERMVLQKLQIGYFKNWVNNHRNC